MRSTPTITPIEEDAPVSEAAITCPKCSHEFLLTESLAAPMIEAVRREYDQKLAGFETEVAQRLDAERAKVVAEEAERARRTVALDLKSARDQLAESNRLLAEREGKLAEAQAAQADLIKARRELDDQRREMTLTVEKQVQAALGAERDKARSQAADELNLKLREKDETIR